MRKHKLDLLDKIVDLCFEKGTETMIVVLVLAIIIALLFL